MLRKISISYPLMCKRAYLGVWSYGFPENFAHVPNDWSKSMIKWMMCFFYFLRKITMPAKLYNPYNFEKIYEKQMLIDNPGNWKLL